MFLYVRPFAAWRHPWRCPPRRDRISRARPACGVSGARGTLPCRRYAVAHADYVDVRGREPTIMLISPQRTSRAVGGNRTPRRQSGRRKRWPNGPVLTVRTSYVYHAFGTVVVADMRATASLNSHVCKHVPALAVPDSPARAQRDRDEQRSVSTQGTHRPCQRYGYLPLFTAERMLTHILLCRLPVAAP